MTLVAPSVDPVAWAQPIVNGRRWLGDCRVTGCDSVYPWEVKKGKGTDGATTSPQGKDLAKPKITFRFWRGWREGEYWDGYAAWAEYRAAIEPPANGEQSAIVVEHPKFSLAKIRGVVIEKIGDTVDTEGGYGEATVEFLEYRKPKKAATGAPKGASKGSGAGTIEGSSERPKTQIELETEKLNESSAKLLEELKA
jgi:hypothetical protein